MSQSAENSECAIACAIADAQRFAQEMRPLFGLLVLQQALDLAVREQGAGCAWAGEAVARVEAEIRRFRAEYRLEGL